LRISVRSSGTQCSLFEAIERAAEGRGATFNGALAPATVQQINDTSQWIANKFFSDAWQIQPVSIKKSAADQGMDTHAKYYKTNISALSVHIRTIISNRNFHHLNLHDIEGAGKLVGELVKLDRLPIETSLQGLILIKDAWCEYDVAMLMASKYKFRSRLIFVIQLFLSCAFHRTIWQLRLDFQAHKRRPTGHESRTFWICYCCHSYIVTRLNSECQDALASAPFLCMFA